MSAGASPYALLRRALERGSLFQAEMAARKCKHVRLDDSLAQLRLYAKEAHPRFDAAAVRWLGRLLAEHPSMGFERAALALDAVRGLAGVSGGGSWLQTRSAAQADRREASARVLERER